MLFLVLIYNVVSAAIISVPPVDTVGCYGGESIFYCESERNDVLIFHWHINSVTLTNETMSMREISVHPPVAPYYSTNGTVSYSTLTIVGIKTNDGIHIGCTVVVSNGTYVDTKGAIFTVSDIPPVENLTIVFTNNGVMTCTWSEPSCLPHDCYFHMTVNNETHEAILCNDYYPSYSQNVSSCINYTVSVAVGNSLLSSYNGSVPSTMSTRSGLYEDVDFTFVHEQSVVRFATVEFQCYVDLFFKFLNIDVIQNCEITFVQELSPSGMVPLSESLTIDDLWESYDESTDIGNYTIGPFNESFKANYSLLYGNTTLDYIMISTFHVQSVNITQLSNGSTVVECYFALDSFADGCCVEFISSNKIFVTVYVSARDSSVNTLVVPAGDYSINAYDVVNGVTITATPAITMVTTITSIPLLVYSAINTFTSTLSTTSVSGSQSSISMTTPTSPTIDTNVTLSSSSSNFDTFLVGIGIGVIIPIVIVAVITFSIIAKRNHTTRNQIPNLSLENATVTTLKPTAELNVYSKLPGQLTAAAVAMTTDNDPGYVENIPKVKKLLELTPADGSVETVLDDDDDYNSKLTTPSTHTSHPHHSPDYENTMVIQSRHNYSMKTSYISAGDQLQVPASDQPSTTIISADSATDVSEQLSIEPRQYSHYVNIPKNNNSSNTELTEVKTAWTRVLNSSEEEFLSGTDIRNVDSKQNKDKDKTAADRNFELMPVMKESHTLFPFGYIAEESVFTRKSSSVSQCHDDKPNSSLIVHSSYIRTALDDVKVATVCSDSHRYLHLRKATEVELVEPKNNIMKSGLCGPHGSGKTSTVQLLTGQEPTRKHDSTSLLKPEQYYKAVVKPLPQPKENDNSEWNSDQDKEGPHRITPTNKQRIVAPIKQDLIVSSKDEWQRGTHEILDIFAMAICVCPGAERKATGCIQMEATNRSTIKIPSTGTSTI